MTAEIIDGKAIAAQMREEIAADVVKLGECGVKPGVATILVGDDGGAHFYRGMIEKSCATIGFAYFSHVLPAETSEADVLKCIADLNADAAVHGILTLMPMPDHIERNNIFNAVAPIKDIDCVNPANMGHVLLGDQLFAPATPMACMEILDKAGVDLTGLNVTIVNRSPIVGKPFALLALQRNATVRIVHTKTKDLAGACAEADVLVSGVTVPNVIKGNFVKEGAVVIDVTTASVDGKQVGSLDWDAVVAKASKVTPVPGGVGPVTNVALLKCAVIACKAQSGIV